MLEILSILENTLQRKYFNKFLIHNHLSGLFSDMESDDVIGLPGPLWSQRVVLPRDVSYYMDWTSIEPGEVLALERLALDTARKCNERIAFLAAPPMDTFGIISHRPTTYIIPADEKTSHFVEVAFLKEKIQGFHFNL